MSRAIKALTRSPRFTLTALLCWGLGVGAATITYAVADAFFFRPPRHVGEPRSVVRLHGIIRREGSEPTTATKFAFTHLEALAAAAPDAHLAAYEVAGQPAFVGNQSVPLRTAFVSRAYFDVVRAHPVHGTFALHGRQSELPSLVISEDLSQRFFADAGDVIGQAIRIRDRHFRVVGVAPSGFTGGEATAIDVWVPLEDVGDLARGKSWQSAESWWLTIIARLPSESRRASFEAQASVVMAREVGKSRRRVLRAPQMVTSPLVPSADPASSLVGKAVFMVAAAGLTLLLIASVNVGGLFLLRGIARQRDLGIRRVLGASTHQLIMEIGAEMALLVAAAAVTASILVWQLGTAITTFLAPDLHLFPSTIGLRSVVITGTLAIIGAGVAGGIAAAGVLMTPGLASFGADRLTPPRSLQTVRFVVLAGQTAMASLLVAGAAILTANLMALKSLDLGMQVRGVALIATGRSYALENSRQVHEQLTRLQRRVRMLPGIEGTSLAATAPFYSAAGVAVNAPDHAQVWQTRAGVPYLNVVDAEFFRTVGMRLRRGRFLAPQDTIAGQHVVVVNQTFAAVAWPSIDPLGRCIILGADARNPCYRVIGVVDDVRRFKLTPEEPTMQVYITLQHNIFESYQPAILLVKAGDLRTALPVLSRIVREEVASNADVSLSMLEDVVDPQIRPWRSAGGLWAMFGAMALILTSVGVYSTLAYAAEQRRREMAIRLALGANVWGMILGMARTNVIVCCAGTLLGVAGALTVARLRLEQLAAAQDVAPVLVVFATTSVLVVIVVSSVWPLLKWANRPLVRALQSS